MTEHDEQPLCDRFTAVSVLAVALTAAGVLFLACYVIAALVLP